MLGTYFDPAMQYRSLTVGHRHCLEPAVKNGKGGHTKIKLFANRPSLADRATENKQVSGENALRPLLSAYHSTGAHAQQMVGYPRYLRVRPKIFSGRRIGRQSGRRLRGAVSPGQAFQFIDDCSTYARSLAGRVHGDRRDTTDAYHRRLARGIQRTPTERI
jgi:hypothetical protein